MLTPLEMVDRYGGRWGNRRVRWAAVRLPDGSGVRQSVPVFTTRREALDLATRWYVAWRALRGMSWDSAIGLQYRTLHDAFFAIYRDRLEAEERAAA